jgi:hypothetical protein
VGDGTGGNDGTGNGIDSEGGWSDVAVTTAGADGAGGERAEPGEPTIDAKAKKERRHFMFAAERGGGMGFEGLGDSIRCTVVVDYVVRRAAVGSTQAALTKYQEAQLWTMSTETGGVVGRLGTRWDDGERYGEWAMQRVHKALPEGAHIYEAPEPWYTRGGERGEGLWAWSTGMVQLWQERPV